MEHGCPPAVGLDALGREGPEGAIQMENFKLFSLQDLSYLFPTRSPPFAPALFGMSCCVVCLVVSGGWWGAEEEARGLRGAAEGYGGRRCWTYGEA